MCEREDRFRTMARRILILHDPDSSPNSYLHLFAGFELRQLDWRSYGFRRLHDSHADLIVPIAVDNETGVVELLRSFRQNPIAIPIFPLLSADASSELLTLVSDVAADFAVWPTQRDE